MPEIASIQQGAARTTRTRTRRTSANEAKTASAGSRDARRNPHVLTADVIIGFDLVRDPYKRAAHAAAIP